MTRKHFQMLADHMVATRNLYANDEAYWTAVQMLADRLSFHNSNFNKGLFGAACMTEADEG